jgi:hypothetical protein
MIVAVSSTLRVGLSWGLGSGEARRLRSNVIATDKRGEPAERDIEIVTDSPLPEGADRPDV